MSAWSDAQSQNMLISHRYGDGVVWTYLSTGISENGAPPRVNTPDLVAQVFSTFGTDLKETATADDMPIELLVSCICTFAAQKTGSAAAAAFRETLPGFVSEDATPELIFAGCTGMRFDRVRRVLGNVSLADYMAVPSNAITAASRYILSQIADTRFQVPMVGAAFNSDALRFDATSRWRMVNQSQTDDFVAWFNTAIAAVQMNGTLAGTSPTFTSVLAQIPSTTPLVTPNPQQPNQWNLTKPESVAAMAAGVMTICETNPSLSTIWALDAVTTDQIGAVAKDAASGLGLPMDQPFFQYPDRSGIMRTMTSDEIQRLYKAMRNYVIGIVLYDTGRAPALPGQPVLIA